MATPKVSSFHLESVVVELMALEEVAFAFTEHTSKDMDAAAAQAFRAKCEALIKEGQLQLLVESFLECLQNIGAGAALEDTQARFAILFSLARHLSGDTLATVVPRITKVVSALPAKDGAEAERDMAMRLEVMRNLYTVMDPRAPSRCDMLVTMLNFATVNRLFTILDGTSAGDIEELCAQWSATPEAALAQKRKLYKMFCDLAELKRQSATPDTEPEALRADELKQHRFLLKLLASYDATPDAVAEVSQYAARAAFIAIKHPLPGDMAESNTLEEHSLEGLKRAAAAVLAAEQAQRVDWATLTASPSALAHLAAVKHLANVPQHAALHRLLQVFASEGLAEFKAFLAEEPKLLGELGLDTEQCTSNMRFLTLASLAANNETLSYDTIVKALQVEEADVERWVIDAVTRKVVDVKMDQQNRSIVINRGSQRLFSDKQWGEVQVKLSQWKNSVRELLGTIKSVRQEHQLLQQQQ